MIVRAYQAARRRGLVPDPLHNLLRTLRGMYRGAVGNDQLLSELNYLRSAVADLKRLYELQADQIEELRRSLGKDKQDDA
jgi:hypothetical protein